MVTQRMSLYPVHNRFSPSTRTVCSVDNFVGPYHSAATSQVVHSRSFTILLIAIIQHKMSVSYITVLRNNGSFVYYFQVNLKI